MWKNGDRLHLKKHPFSVCSVAHVFGHLFGVQGAALQTPSDSYRVPLKQQKPFQHGHL